MIQYNKYNKTVLLAFGLILAQQGASQNNTSPYSMLGIGHIRTEPFDYSSGMSGTAISQQAHRYILDANPASLAFLDDHYFALEVGTGFQSTKYSGNSLESSARSNQAQVQRFAMATKLAAFWGASVSLKQFSSSNYSLNGVKNIVGTNDFLSTYYEGSGGINQVSFSNGFRLGNNFSLGINASYLFGSLMQSESLYAQNYIGTQLNTTNQTYYSNFYFEGGMQYKGKIAPKLVIGLGMIAARKTTLNGTKLLSISAGDPSEGSPTNIVSDSTIGTAHFDLPNMLGGGISLEYNRSLTLAADYRYEPWDKEVNSSGGNNYGYTNSSQLSFGLQYAPKKMMTYQQHLVEVEHYFFQAGAYINRDYISIRGQQIKDAGMSMGIGVNSLRSSLGYLLSFSYGSMGTLQNNLIKEDYFKIGVTISYRDLWKKRRLQ